MTKIQNRDVQQARQAIAMGMADCAARIISASIRCAMRASDRAALLAIARELAIVNHPDFII